ncbi:CBS domain-containing protein [Poriferisphaera sp. WC338]|uniref:CBS domain-containing protein n=1 Tax=Poriferisphaera sp. WC338 TaxID=3425129 RepID=UPI003D8142F7
MSLAMKQVRDIMTCEITRGRVDFTLREARRLFNKHGFHHLLIFDKRELVGIISDRDILRHTSPFIEKMAERTQDLATLNKPVHQIMSRNLTTIPAAAAVKHAAKIMLSKRVSCLPVTDENGHVIGLVTHRDLLQLFNQAA